METPNVIHTMKDPSTAAWGLSISDTDLAKLRDGFVPKSQDDKWRIWVSDDDQNGNIAVTIARTAFRVEVAIFHIKTDERGNTIESITWEQSLGKARVSEEQAKKRAVLISRKIAQCDIEALPEDDITVMYNREAPLEKSAE
jgi:hypothetical protein